MMSAFITHYLTGLVKPGLIGGAGYLVGVSYPWEFLKNIRIFKPKTETQLVVPTISSGKENSSPEPGTESSAAQSKTAWFPLLASYFNTDLLTQTNTTSAKLLLMAAIFGITYWKGPIRISQWWWVTKKAFQKSIQKVQTGVQQIQGQLTRTQERLEGRIDQQGQQITQQNHHIGQQIADLKRRVHVIDGKIDRVQESISHVEGETTQINQTVQETHQNLGGLCNVVDKFSFSPYLSNSVLDTMGATTVPTVTPVSVI